MLQSKILNIWIRGFLIIIGLFMVGSPFGSQELLRDFPIVYAVYLTGSFIVIPVLLGGYASNGREILVDMGRAVSLVSVIILSIYVISMIFCVVYTMSFK